MLSLLALLSCSLSCTAPSIDIKYSTVTLDDPLVYELVMCPSFQRLKDIAQYGAYAYVVGKPYSRFEHSLGVYYVLRSFGASRLEQVAGLLHDASHTIFSHVGDYVFGQGDGENSYQDDHHMVWLMGTEIPAILEKYGISLESVNHKNPEFKMLEQKLPHLCADRIEYNFVAGLLENLITPGALAQLIEHLHYDHQQEIWYFDDAHQARIFADISVYNTQYVWGCPLSVECNKICATLIRRALDLGIITEHEAHYSTETAVLAKFNSCNDAQIQSLLAQWYALTQQACPVHEPIKCRAVDPFVLVYGEYRRLSELDQQYAGHYRSLQNWCYQA